MPSRGLPSSVFANGAEAGVNTMLSAAIAAIFDVLLLIEFCPGLNNGGRLPHCQERSLWLTQQVRQLGDVGGDPPLAIYFTRWLLGAGGAEGRFLGWWFPQLGVSTPRIVFVSAIISRASSGIAE